MHKWQLQEAKAQLSEVVRLSMKQGPQSITLRGEEVAILVSKKDYDKLTHKQETFLSFMTSSPLKGIHLPLERDKSSLREVTL